MSASATALLGLILWSIILTFGLVIVRAAVLSRGGKELNTFAPDGRDMPAFGQRFTRAHLNSLEYLAIPVGLLAYAIATGQAAVTDGLAMWVVAGRVAQSVTHMLSTSNPMVLTRATFFTVQALVWIYWTLALLTA